MAFTAGQALFATGADRAETKSAADARSAIGAASTVEATASTDGLMTKEYAAKLDGVEDNATADQTGAEIKTAYEAEADTNAYTDAEKTKLAGVASGAEVNPALMSQAEAEGGSDTNERVVSALRIKQAIDALGILLADFGAKGQIVVATGVGAVTTLAVGSNDQVLTADSGEASGVKWAAASGGDPETAMAFAWMGF